MKNTGAELIAAERQRQVLEEGWTSAHDDEWRDSELIMAAACYLPPALSTRAPNLWPWANSWWKPSSHIRNLVKAGALIAAEIDRLQRVADRESKDGGA